MINFGGFKSPALLLVAVLSLSVLGSSQSPQSIQLVDAAQIYKALPQQINAWNYLQGQLTTDQLSQFADLYRNGIVSSIPFEMVNAAEYYQNLPYHNAAFNWLQSQLSSSVVSEFARFYSSNNSPANLSPASVGVSGISSAAYNQAVDLIKRHEGLRLTAYVDTTGHATIGYGHMIKPGEHYTTISMDTANQLLEQDLQSAVSGAKKAAPFIGSLCQNAQAVLIDMTFNLGTGGIESFRGFLSYLSAKNYAGAANDLTKTLWYSQTGNRAVEDVGLLRRC